MEGKLKAVLPAMLIAGSALVAYGVYKKYFGVKATLPKLLKKSRQFTIEYKVYLSNHLPMALIALEKLGASRQQLEAFYTKYITRLEPRPPASQPNPITTGTLRDYLGKKVNFQDFVDFFDKERRRLGGIQPLLAEYLPTLLEGINTAAFHALLLLGYGLDYNPSEPHLIVEGVAYLAYAFCSLGMLPLTPRHDATLSIDFRAIRRDGLFDKLSVAGIERFPNRMQVLGSGDWPAVLDRYDLGHSMSTGEEISRVLEGITRAVIELYDVTNDFFVLHIVTGLQAFKLVLPYVPNQEKARAVRYFWRAAVAAYVAQGAPVLPEKAQISTQQPASTQSTTSTASPELPSWDQLKQKAIVSYDEHVIKFVYTCWREVQSCTDPALETLFRKSAATRAGMLPTP